MQSWLEGRNLIGKGAQATGMTASLRIQSSKADSNTWRASQGVNWSWSQCIKSHHTLASSRKGLPSHLWNRNIVRSILPGLKGKITELLLSGPKPSFQMKVNFAFNLEIKVPESGGRLEMHIIHVSWSPVWSFHRSVMIWAAMSSAGVGPLCFLKSTVNAGIYQDILEHFMCLSADKLYGDADFIFQQDLAPAHTAKGTKSWFNDHSVTVLDWPVNLSDLNPYREYMGYYQEEDERHQTQQCRWPEGRYKRNLGFHYTWAVPQADYRCIDAVIHAKGGPTKYWVHINILSKLRNIHSKPDFSEAWHFCLKYHFFYYWSYVIF